MNAAVPDLQRGTYPLAEAARLARMRARTARRWVEGYDYLRDGERRRSEGVPYLLPDAYATALRPIPGSRGRPAPVLDFEQLLTLLLVRAFHEKGLSLRKIKAAAAKAKDAYHLENPFISNQFKSDGNRVFIDLDRKASGAREREMIDVLSDQRQFREIVEPSLFRDVVFFGDRAGEWWPLGKHRAVVVAPGRLFGQPHVAGSGVRTDVVSDMVEAEGGGQNGANAAADWYGLTADQVADAVEFEEWLRTPPQS